MRYLIAFACPPLAVLLCGRIVVATVSAVLWVASIALIFVFGIGLLLWGALAIHALLVVRDSVADKRQQKIVSAMHASRSRPY